MFSPKFFCNFAVDMMKNRPNSSLQSLHIVAYTRNGFTDKFGIPRQSRDGSLLLTRIVFTPDFRVREALRGIEGYSHLWLLWGFSDLNYADMSDSPLHWSPTVRPPRLGGNTRMGVFATRSPYRPNPIGLTSVRLLRVEESDEGLTLLVSGADLLDGTPIYDIKPYLSFSDSHPDAVNGFAEAPKDYHLPVVFSPEAERECSAIKAELIEILSQDPRPAYQDNPDRIYGLTYSHHEVKFLVKNQIVHVFHVSKTENQHHKDI